MGAGIQGQSIRLIDAVGAPGIQVHLLQHHHIRVQRLDTGLDPVQIGQHLLLIGGTHVFAAVHKEIALCAQTAIANVPAQYLQFFFRVHLAQRTHSRDLHALHRGRLEFRHAQPQDQSDSRQYHHQQQNPQHFQNFFHGTTSMISIKSI